MKVRGATYLDWVDPQLHCRCHSEVLPNGATIDVQVRLSRTGGTQLFLGVYERDVHAVIEEAMDMPGKTMTTALIWGTQRARELALEDQQPLVRKIR